MDLLLESDLHTRVLQTKLSPNLSNFISPMREELDFAMEEEIPVAEGEYSMLHGEVIK